MNSPQLWDSFKKKAIWPNPKDSTGQFYGKKEGRLCWKAQGPAREAFNKVAPAIKNHLNSCSSAVPNSDWVTWSIYMIGRSETTAVPTIMFECSQKGPRKEAMNQVRKSGILDRYPGIQTGHWPFPPNIVYPRQLGLIHETSSTHSDARPSASSTHPLGMHIVVRAASDDSDDYRKATVGGIIRRRGKNCYFTVSHPFMGNHISAHGMANFAEDDDECDFGSQSGPEDDSDDDALVEITSRGSGTPDSNSEGNLEDESTEEDDFKISESDDGNANPHRITLDMYPRAESNDRTIPAALSHTASGTNLEDELNSIPEKINPFVLSDQDLSIASTTLDYALIDSGDDDNTTFLIHSDIPVLCTKDGIPVISQDRVANITLEETSIVTVTGSTGLLTGMLSGLPSYTRLPGSMAYHEVFTVRLNGPLHAGDCGSCIFDTDTGALYGHIVAGSPITQVAYIMPAVSVFTDIELHHGPGDSRATRTANTNPYHRLERSQRFQQSQSLNQKLRHEASAHRPSSIFRKVWKPVFAEDRSPWDEERADETKQKSRPSNIRVLSSPTVHWEVDAIAKFCVGVSLKNLNSQLPHQRRNAWLDDRPYDPWRATSRPEQHERREKSDPEIGGPEQLSNTNYRLQEKHRNSEPPLSGNTTSTHSSRQYQARLSAAELFHHLSQRRLEHVEQPEANRRLIYIQNLSPESVLALVETAPQYQVPALRDALCKHLGLRMSMKIKLSSRGYSVFRMDFHVPYYALTTCLPKECHGTSVYTKPSRTWMDISFLADRGDKVLKDNTLGIHEAHISFAICGTTESHWVAYMFEDTDFNEDEEPDQNQSSCADALAKQMTSDKEVTIWNPREYYLLIVGTKVKQVVRDWKILVFSFEEGIQRYTEAQTLLSKHVEKKGDAMATFEWTQRTLQLLHKLLDHLSKTNAAWHRFAQPDGDINYFSDIDLVPTESQERIKGHLLRIQEKFEDLEDLQGRLKRLQRQCQNSADILQLRLVLESNKAAKLNGSTSEMFIFIISPLAVVSALFAIPEPFGIAHGPFGRNWKVFGSAVLIVFVFLKLLVILQQGLLGLRRYSWFNKIVERLDVLGLNGDDSTDGILTRYYKQGMLIQRSFPKEWMAYV